MPLLQQVLYLIFLRVGRVSDTYLTLKCDFLKLLEPDDVVLTDRGFNIEEDVAFYGVRLVIPSFFTKGKKQLSSQDVETSRKIARVRIHVE